MITQEKITVLKTKQAKSSCTVAVHSLSKWYRCHQLNPHTDRHASNTFHLFTTLGTLKESLYIKFLCALLLNTWYIHTYLPKVGKSEMGSPNNQNEL